MSTRSVAAKLGTSPASVSRTETGARRPTTEEVFALCALYGVTGELRERLLTKARNPPTREPTGLLASDDYADQLSNIQLLENEAAKVTEYGLVMIPGLLQTPDYARAVISTVDRTRAEIERRVATRIGRQTVLSRPDGPELEFLIDELALHRQVGGPAVLRRQLRHLCDCVQWSHARVLVIPVSAGAYAGLDGPFIRYEFNTLDPYIHLENRKGGVFLTDPAVTREYREMCEHFRELAYSDGDSIGLIKRMSEAVSDAPSRVAEK